MNSKLKAKNLTTLNYSNYRTNNEIVKCFKSVVKCS